jgi:hypothetical protein
MKKSQFDSTLSVLALIVLTALLMSGCATYSAQPPADADEKVADEPAWTVEPWDGYGLEIPLNGSSMEAWERSLISVKAYSEPADYRLLLSAIDYLLLYDLGAKGDMNALITRLDGLTGYEVLARVNWRKPAPGKGPAEKGSRNASLIDSE